LHGIGAMNDIRALAVLAVLLAGLVGCQSAKARPDLAASTSPSSPAVVSVGPPDADVVSPTPAPPPPEQFVPVPRLADIHFDYDTYEVRAEDARILDENAAWLQANPGSLVLIEGHTDERGSSEYNLGLGDLRARAAMRYLAARGVPAARMVAISYGKERPLCTEHHEACWAENRRAHFLVKPL
jgi:peptidoglycan-associated lipoprotein